MIGNLKCAKSLSLKVFCRATTTTLSSATRCYVSSAVKLDSVVVSGIQPTGVPHLGNYLGAISHWLKLKQSGDYSHLYFMIVDYHALTVKPTAEQLKADRLASAASLAACGLVDDDDKVSLFYQSQVSGHSELAWILSCLCPLSRLQHLPNWKEKGPNNTGIFTYPCLQSADILLYRGTHVPVGLDQLMHVELSRDLATKFNTTYCPKPKPLFPSPIPLLPDKDLPLGKVLSLRHPEHKMSKSDTDINSRLDITDSPDVIKSKLQVAVTDSTKTLTYEPDKRPAVANLIQLYSIFTHQTPEESIEKDLHSLNKKELKEKLTELLAEYFQPVRTRFDLIMREPQQLNIALSRGASKASETASKTMIQVKQLLGLE